MSKKHIHSEVIKAWADGAEIEYFDVIMQEWIHVFKPSWSGEITYRIKPTPKPDIVQFVAAIAGAVYITCYYTPCAGINLKLTFDGETGTLKAAEVI